MEKVDPEEIIAAIKVICGALEQAGVSKEVGGAAILAMLKQLQKDGFRIAMVSRDEPCP